MRHRSITRSLHRPRSTPAPVCLCLWTSDASGKGRELGEILRSEIQGQPARLETFRDLAHLSRRLCEYGREPRIIILQPGSREDLTALLALKNFLDHFPLILLLPDAEAGTIAEGHLLWPRFLTSSTDFRQVAEILKRMVARMQSSGDSLEEIAAEG